MQSQNFDHIHNTDGIYLQCEQPDELSVVVLLQTVYHTFHTYMALRLQYKTMAVFEWNFLTQDPCFIYLG